MFQAASLHLLIALFFFAINIAASPLSTPNLNETSLSILLKHITDPAAPRPLRHHGTSLSTLPPFSPINSPSSSKAITIHYPRSLSTEFIAKALTWTFNHKGLIMTYRHAVRIHNILYQNISTEFKVLKIVRKTTSTVLHYGTLSLAIELFALKGYTWDHVAEAIVYFAEWMISSLVGQYLLTFTVALYIGKDVAALIRQGFSAPMGLIT
ncbi:MAG: hypothetical protein Q9183_005616 [Haloplaca sp. 2 TL-2023]